MKTRTGYLIKRGMDKLTCSILISTILKHRLPRPCKPMPVATEKGLTPNQAVLAWMFYTQPPVMPLVGTGNVEQLRENLAALNTPLTSDDRHRLNKAGA